MQAPAPYNCSGWIPAADLHSQLDPLIKLIAPVVAHCLHHLLHASGESEGMVVPTVTELP